MILIVDEIHERSIDVRRHLMKILEFIEVLQNQIADEKCSPRIRAEASDAIAFYQSQIQELNEMQEVPFDVLVVVEKEG